MIARSLLLPMLAALCACSPVSKRTDVKGASVTADTLAQRLAEEFHARELPDSVGNDIILKTFTIDLERLLLDQPTPILFRADLADVKSEQGDTLAVFEPELVASLDVYWVLKVPTRLVDSLLSAGRQRFYVRLAVVANITSISRPLISIDGGGSAIDRGAPTLEPTVAEYFIARGELLGFRVLPH